eukprot:13372064-Ditylum_brightwellii.AAC.1
MKCPTADDYDDGDNDESSSSSSDDDDSYKQHSSLPPPLMEQLQIVTTQTWSQRLFLNRTNYINQRIVTEFILGCLHQLSNLNKNNSSSSSKS